MESLAETTWDVIISSTGLLPALLALALSRSDKKILHIDRNDYYGGAEAALSLQEAEEWARQNASDWPDAGDGPLRGGHFARAQYLKSDGDGLSFSRAYSLALCPQIVHARSKLLELLVTSKAYRQVEFLAVGSFFVYVDDSESGSNGAPHLIKIPSTREDVFSSTVLSGKSKRLLMKFLKFVLSHTEESEAARWQPHRDETLSSYLTTNYKLSFYLQSLVLALTFSLDGRISVADGLAALQRHLLSMGTFGTGFAAVYAKFGGNSEVAQVSCRAGAVGGAVYALGTESLKETTVKNEEGQDMVELSIEGVAVRGRRLVKVSDEAQQTQRVSRLVAVINSRLEQLFEPVREGPDPAVAVVAFPANSLSSEAGNKSDFPVYAMAHFDTTGECPRGQSILYLTTVASPASKRILDLALSSLLRSISAPGSEPPNVLCQLSYEQAGGESALSLDDTIVSFPFPSVGLAFEDSQLEHVRRAWEAVGGDDGDATDFMKFEDREGTGEDDDVYDV